MTPTEWQADPDVGSLYRGWSGHNNLLGFGLWTDGYATAQVDLEQEATRLVLEAGGDRCEAPSGQSRGPSVIVYVDSLPVLYVDDLDADRGQYNAFGRWSSGPHTVQVRYRNDYRDEGCDRNLKISRVWLEDEPQGWSQVHLRGSSLTRSLADVGTLYTKGSRGEPTQMLWANGALRGSVHTQQMQTGFIGVRASAHQCEGAPRMVVRLDDRHVGQVSVGPDRNGQLREYAVPLDVPLTEGSHRLTIQFVDDLRTPNCDRNLMVGTVSVYGSP